MMAALQPIKRFSVLLSGDSIFISCFPGCQSSLLSTAISFVYTKTNGGDSYFLFHALSVFFIKYCHKLCIQRQMVVQ